MSARIPRFLAAVAVVVTTIASLGPGAARAQHDAADAQELADRYVPVVMLKEQSGPCDTEGEAFAPTSVDVVLDNGDVTLRQAGTGDPVVTRGPSAADLFGRGEGFFLDFNGLALKPGCVYEQDFDAYSAERPSAVYAHIVQQDGVDDRLVIQYWLYWYYNDWNNKHESDWEFIQVVFEASSVAEALDTEPIEVGYAQHEGGERASWDDDKLERRGTHPVVYSSAGSHASYFDSTVFLGRRGTEGVGCDTTLGPSVETRPEAIVIPSSVSSADDEFAWLGFEGRWGERQSGPFNGPTGPNTKEQWTHPIDWQDALRDRSATIPASNEGTETLLDTFCDVVEWGSEQFRQALVSPTRLLVVGLLAFFIVRWAARRTDWSPVPATPLRRRRRTGQIIRGSVTSYWHSGGGILALAVVYLPAALVVGVAGALSFPFGQTVAGFLTTVMYLLSIGLLAAFWHLASDGGGRPLVETSRLVWRRLPALILTSLLATAIVTVLSLTIVLLPLAIRQLVRYQAIVPVVVTEELSGRSALRRSTELVRGRWWYTALMTALFFGMTALVNSFVQLTLLFAMAGIPFWVYLMVSFLVTALFVPLIATPPVLLYGDAVADHAERAAAEAGADAEPVTAASDADGPAG